MSTKNKMRKKKCSMCGSLLYNDGVSHDKSHNLCYSCWSRGKQSKKTNSRERNSSLYGKDVDGGNFRLSTYKCVNCGSSMIHFRSNGGYGLKCNKCGKAWFKD